LQCFLPHHQLAAAKPSALSRLRCDPWDPLIETKLSRTGLVCCVLERSDTPANSMWRAHNSQTKLTTMDCKSCGGNNLPNAQGFSDNAIAAAK
jgi:hypothetical protein